MLDLTLVVDCGFVFCGFAVRLEFLPPLDAYMYGRKAGDAQWLTMTDKYNATGKKQTRTVRKPRWTIK